MEAFPSRTTVSPGKSPGFVDEVWLLSVELEGSVSSFGSAVVVLSASALLESWDSLGSLLLSIVLKFFKTQLCPVVRIWRKDALFLGNANDKPRHLKDTWSVVLANIYQRKALWPVETKLFKLVISAYKLSHAVFTSFQITYKYKGSQIPTLFTYIFSPFQSLDIFKKFFHFFFSFTSKKYF